MGFVELVADKGLSILTSRDRYSHIVSVTDVKVPSGEQDKFIVLCAQREGKNNAKTLGEEGESVKNYRCKFE